MILDIGSGIPSTHDKRLDIKNVIHADISKKAHHLEIQCSIYNLPFKDSSIKIVYVSHVLEHLDQPIAAIKEVFRVTKKYAIIKVPNSVYFKWKDEATEHIFSWNQSTLYNLLGRYFPKVTINPTEREVGVTRLKKILYLIITLFHRKNEITAICVK